MGCRFLLQGIFQTEESNPSLLHLLHWQANSLRPCRLRSMRQLGLREAHTEANVASLLLLFFMQLLEI